MGRSFQQIIIEGNCGKDPEMRYTPSGRPVTQVNVAVSRSFKGASDEWQEETTWFRCVIWGDQAERFAERAHSGDFVRVTGRLHQTEWDVDGCPKGKHTGMELVADRAEVLGRFEKREGSDFGRSAQDAYVDQLAAGRGAPNQPVAAGVSRATEAVAELDDLPF